MQANFLLKCIHTIGLVMPETSLVIYDLLIIDEWLMKTGML